MTTSFVLLGAALGLGVLMIGAGLLGRRPSLEAELARLDPYGPGAGGLTAGAREGGGALARAGRPLAEAIARLAGGPGRLDEDLSVLGRSRAEHAAAVATGAIAGGALPPLLAAVAAVLGVHVPLSVPAIGCAAAGAAGAGLPVVELRRRARTARARFRQALASWLELVALAQAAGMGLESALQSASATCDDASFRRIRQAVDVARGIGRPPWDALARLGSQLGIADLEELGSNLALAGAEGARIRASLMAKAASLRRRELAEAESEANAVTERLFLPSIVLMLGFLVLVGYPALVTVAHVL